MGVWGYILIGRQGRRTSSAAMVEQGVDGYP